jgi:hypothetical protein
MVNTAKTWYGLKKSQYHGITGTKGGSISPPLPEVRRSGGVAEKQRRGPLVGYGFLSHFNDRASL